MSGIERPDLGRILGRLKAFQRRTVDYAFERLYTASDSTHRFLVADEVGLGKTLVARGVIARAIDHFWDTVDRIDIVYICSNAAIARQNIRKLDPGLGGANRVTLATRLTLLPAELKGLRDRKLNIVSFTPGTSFDMRSKGGAHPERVVLYRLLRDVVGDRSGLRNLLQGGVGGERWRRSIDGDQELDASLRDDFVAELAGTGQADLRRTLDEMCGEFHRRREWSDDERRRRAALVGELRMLLAGICLRALEPDLVILDEFQRFKHLLRAEDEMGVLANTLFKYKAPEGHACPVLLLSATPYKMYSTDGEVGDDDHYPDFLATTAFLMDDPERLGRFEGDLRAYRRALQRAMQGDADGIEAARAPVERELRRVMVRTERVAATEDRCGMLREVEIHAPLAPEDVRQYAVVDAVARALDEADPIELWKSAPYLLNFMKGYKLKERLDESLRRPDVADALRRGREDLLPRRTIKHYGEVEPSNPRLRALADEMLGRERWRLLWVPPSLPYRPFRPPFDTAGARFTKALVFSAWNVVPDAVSALLSYEAERRMLGSRDVTYALLHRQVRPLLRYAVSEGRASGMPVLALSYPCLRLADEVSPLELRLRHGESFGTAIQEQVVGLVASLQDGEGATDERWYWAVPLLLDQVRGGRAFLESWMLERLVEGGEGEDEAGRDEGSQFRRHAAEALDLIEGKTRLGRKPADLVGVVSELALGAPGILAARSLRCVGAGDEARRRAAARVGEGFRSLFNQPAATALIRREMPDDLPYWRAVLQYADAGNLQALLDEYLHQLREQGGWNHADPDEAAERLGAEMADAATIKTSRVGAEVYRVHGSAARAVRLNLRTGFALRYGVLRTDAQEVQARENAVRLAFNSPFHPFVLATTSVGQEGLDFHTWCHAVYHWNLPGNPVDLEQREGRVHRYKGHAIRRNVAAKLGLGALAGRWVPGDDPWERLFECAIERFSRGDELVPCWVFDGDHKVERRLPLLPYSREVERFRRLKRDLVAYRVVFGQPRQQELLEALRHTGLGAEAIGRWVLDLRPRGGEGRRCGEAR